MRLDIKRKISTAQIGRKDSEETKMKKSIAAKNVWELRNVAVG
jgi:hypothetical protein